MRTYDGGISLIKQAMQAGLLLALVVVAVNILYRYWSKSAEKAAAQQQKDAIVKRKKKRRDANDLNRSKMGSPSIDRTPEQERPEEKGTAANVKGTAANVIDPKSGWK